MCIVPSDESLRASVESVPQRLKPEITLALNARLKPTHVLLKNVFAVLWLTPNSSGADPSNPVRELKKTLTHDGFSG